MPDTDTTTPQPQDLRAVVARLHSEGLGRNAIAKQAGCATGTVSKLAAELGLTFDRRDAAAATEARRHDARAKRQELELLYLGEAKRLLREMRRPTLVYNFGGKDNTYEEHTLPEADHTGKLKLMQASGIALDKALRLADADSDTGVEQARSMLGTLAAGLKAAYNATQPAEPLPA